MRRNEYNLRYPNSSISVTQFLVCEDLNDQFNTANDNGGDDGGGGSGVVTKHQKVNNVHCPLL